MNKLILTLSCVSVLFLTSCDGDKNVDVKAPTDTPTTTTTVDEPVVTEETEVIDNTPSVSASEGVPSFDNAELQDYINAYEAYFEDYKVAMESMDMQKVQDLNAKGQELTQKSTAFTDINDDDAKKLSEYMEAKAKEMQDIAMKATGQ